jgi:hypothetical protein
MSDETIKRMQQFAHELGAKPETNIETTRRDAMTADQRLTEDNMVDGITLAIQNLKQLKENPGNTAARFLAKQSCIVMQSHLSGE